MRPDPSLDGPQFVQYFGPVLDALRDLGGSARPAEVRNWIVENLDVADDVQEELLPSGTPRFDNQIAWARFYLARAAHIDSSRRGVWTLTDKGRGAELDHDAALEVFRTIHAEVQEAHRQAAQESDETDAPAEESESTGADYRQRLLVTLQELPPGGFERFCQRLLRESGFQEVAVKRADGGLIGARL